MKKGNAFPRVQCPDVREYNIQYTIRKRKQGNAFFFPKKIPITQLFPTTLDRSVVISPSSNPILLFSPTITVPRSRHVLEIFKVAHAF